MNPTVRLVLFCVLGAAVGLLAVFDGDTLLPILGVVVGALVALRMRDGERLRSLEARLRALEQDERARRHADDVLGEIVPRPPSEAVEVRPASRSSRPPKRTAPGRERPSRPPLSWDDAPPWAKRAWDFATGGNLVARIGLLVLFVGLGLLIRYAAEQGLFPIGVRLAFAAAVGAVLLGVGWRLRRSAEAFALTLQGGGVAVLYLTVYAAYALYALVPSLTAIVLMALVAVGCGALAVMQGAPTLAVLGVAGGFAAPILAGTTDGNHVLLFSYYALLNLGVLGIAWWKGWRSLAVVGFVSTFVTGGLWGGLSYRPDLYASVQPFVVINFAIYFALAIRFALRSVREGAPPERALVVDGALVFGLPAATFVLQANLIEGTVPYGRAWSAAALAAVYLAGALWLVRRPGVRLVADAFLAVGIVFGTLALPLAFQRVVFGAMWVLEGAGLVWVGARQGKRWMRWGGLTLQAVAASVLFVEGVLSPGRAFNAETLTGWIVAVSLALSAYVLTRESWSLPPSSRPTPPLPQGEGRGEGNVTEPVALTDAIRQPDEPPSQPPPMGGSEVPAGVRRTTDRIEALAGRLFLGFALFWWVTTAAVHVLDLVPESFEIAGLLGAAAASALLFLGLGRVLDWRGLAAAAYGLVAAGWALWVLTLIDAAPPVGGMKGAAWLAVAVVAVLALQTEPARAHPTRRWALVGGVWLAVAVVADALRWSVGAANMGDGWPWGAVGAVIATGLALALRLPSSVASESEWATTAFGLVTAAAGWMVLAAGVAGGTAPLPFLPILNPVDGAALALLLVLAATARTLSSERGRSPLWPLVSGLGFLALSAAVLRAVHHLEGVPWEVEALVASSTTQATLAVVWTLLALALAVTAKRRQSRALWFFGAGVLALVVTKLFLVDLSQAGALVLIGAFIVVGALVILIGYVAPLPPRPAEKATDAGA